jgi:GNAT superfamily N-acetyltransferase
VNFSQLFIFKGVQEMLRSFEYRITKEIEPFAFNLLPKKMISIEQITPELTWRLRRDVLYPSQKMFEMEMEEDTYGIHFGAFNDVKLTGVVSLFQKGYDFQFRKLAVDPTFQKMGIGNGLLKYITDYAQENDGKQIWCNARVTAIGFYLKAGFLQTGNLFSKNGFDYEVMEKELKPAEFHS